MGSGQDGKRCRDVTLTHPQQLVSLCVANAYDSYKHALVAHKSVLSAVTVTDRPVQRYYWHGLRRAARSTLRLQHTRPFCSQWCVEITCIKCQSVDQLLLRWRMCAQANGVFEMDAEHESKRRWWGTGELRSFVVSRLDMKM